MARKLVMDKVVTSRGVYSKIRPASPAGPTYPKLAALSQMVPRGSTLVGCAAGGRCVLGERHDHAVWRYGHVHPGVRHGDPRWPRLLARRPTPGERQLLAQLAAGAA